MQKKTTKPKSIVWDYFVWKSENGKFACKFCNSVYVKNATRMQVHLTKCIKTPIVIKEKFILEGDVPDKNSKLILQNTHEIVPSKYSNITKFMDIMNDPENRELNKLFARAIYSSGTNLSITENPNWKFFFQKLRPSYRLPSRYCLSGPLLEDEFNRVEAKIKLKISESVALGIQCDGWSNRRNESIINFIVTTPNPVFYKTIATKEEKHSGEYISTNLESVLIDIGPEKFYAIITDNATAMIKGRDLLVQKYPQIAAYSCAAHTLNLFIMDIMKKKRISILEADCKNIVKEVNNSHKLKAMLERIQKEKNGAAVSLKLPVKTRWGSFLNCLESLYQTKYALKCLAIELSNEKLSKRSKNCILDDDVYWVRVSKMIEILKPIVKWIKVLESDDPKISIVPEALNEIEHTLNQLLPCSPLTTKEEKKVKENLESRRNMALRPIHFPANILDPKLRGASLTQDEQIVGCEYFDKFLLVVSDFDANEKENIAKEFAEYRAQEGFFSKSYVLKSASSVNSITFWKGTCFNMDLGKVAVKLLSMPATTAATERSFSTYGNIHSAKRNRLTVERAGKLTYVAHNLKFLSNEIELPHEISDLNLNTSARDVENISNIDIEVDSDCISISEDED